jgi:hypothetical protein
MRASSAAPPRPKMHGARQAKRQLSAETVNAEDD